MRRGEIVGFRVLMLTTIGFIWKVKSGITALGFGVQFVELNDDQTRNCNALVIAEVTPTTRLYSADLEE